MDGKQILEAAEWCSSHNGCAGCPAYEDCLTATPIENILAVRDHAKAEGRAEVIAQVRDGLNITRLTKYAVVRLYKQELLNLLDELAGEERNA